MPVRSTGKRILETLCVALVLSLLALAVVSCGEDKAEEKPSWPAPPDGSTYYTESYDLPQTQDAAQLAEFMSSEHLEYDLDGWFFFGSLVNDFAPDDPGAFIISMQRIEVEQNGTKVPYVPAIIAYNDSSLGQYVYGGAQTVDMAPFVSVSSDPWKVTVSQAGQTGPLMTMSLQSGTMGAAGAEYRLTADVTDQLGGKLQAEVLVRDRMGVVGQGYGTASFFPQFLTSDQQGQVEGPYGNSVGDYLKSTGDTMVNQGSFYYSTPLMDVERFTITRDGVVLSSGTAGTMWMDDIVQTYDQQAWDNLGSASWEFFSMMLPEEGVSLMVIQIKSAAGTLPVATLFHTSGTRARNGALEGLYRWDTNEISVEAGQDSLWASPATGQQYAMVHQIHLGSKGSTADLTVTMARQNQEIVAGSTIKYEGLAMVEGTLDGKPVKGTAFVELQPVGHL